MEAMVSKATRPSQMGIQNRRSGLPTKTAAAALSLSESLY
jgi:hypothetical protein